jgi:hypothetical protein
VAGMAAGGEHAWLAGSLMAGGRRPVWRRVGAIRRIGKTTAGASASTHLCVVFSGIAPDPDALSIFGRAIDETICRTADS